jgi:hypothetical protein
VFFSVLLVSSLFKEMESGNDKMIAFGRKFRKLAVLGNVFEDTTEMTSQTAWLFDICLYLTPLGQARQFIET